MKISQTPPSQESPRLLPIKTVRGKIAALALMALSSVGCKASYCFNINTAEGKTEVDKEAARRTAVDEDGTRIIYISEASASVILDKAEIKACRSKITALLDISKISPLLASSDELHEYNLPKDARPWTDLVTAPDGIVGLKMKGNILAMEFKCNNLTAKKDTYCKGKEVDPEELDEKIIAAVKKAEGGAETAGQKEAESDKGTEKKKDEDSKGSGSDKQPVENPTTGTFFKYETSPEIAAKVAQLMPALRALDYEKQKALARKLVPEEYRKKLEKLITEIERGHGGDLTKLNMVPVLGFLLAKSPQKIPETAKGLGVDSPNSERFRELVNQLRAEKHLPPLSYGQCAQKMATYWATQPKAPAGGHKANGETPATRMKKFNCASVMVENVSWPDSFDASHIFQQWKSSSEHRKNMENKRITELGLHCVKDTGVKSGRFCVMVGTAGTGTSAKLNPPAKPVTTPNASDRTKFNRLVKQLKQGAEDLERARKKLKRAAEKLKNSR